MILEKEFAIDIDIINKNFKLESGITHASNKVFKMLPFAANDSKVVIDFKGVVGAFVRLINEKQLSPNFEKESFLKKILELVYLENEDDKEVLLDLINKVFINGDELEYFNLKSLNYIKSDSSEEKIGKFLFSILVNDQLQKELIHMFSQKDNNVLYKLVFQALPELKNKRNIEEKYFCALPYVKDLFLQDIKTLMQDHEFFKSSIQRLLEYYYFFYVSQLALKLNKFEQAEREKAEAVFFTLSWETTSKKRQGYILGWESLRTHIDNLFSHAVALELLNSNNTEMKLDYIGFKQYLSHGDNSHAADEVRQLREQYTAAVQKDLIGLTLEKYNSIEDPLMREIHSLFETVDCQFNNSSRKRAYEGYRNWLVFFMQNNFGKRRGALGYNLNLTEEDVIFFTKLITDQHGGRIRLNLLFIELQKRGIYLDKYSVANVIELYEKLNLLEKKSDSGDAQYVRSIL